MPLLSSIKFDEEKPIVQKKAFSPFDDLEEEDSDSINKSAEK